MDENLNNALKAHDLYWTSYINGQADVVESLLDENYQQIGSVEEEVFFNKKDAVGFVKKTIDQVAGKVELRNRVTKSEKLSGYILINEFFDLYVKTDGNWFFYARFRTSSLMHQTTDGWKLVHQHSSLPDSKAEEGENIAIEKINQENLALKDAIKRRTTELENKNRELEIEAALERVRARAMAMQESDELAEVSSLLFQQMEALGVSTYSSGFTIWDEDQDELISWMCNADGSMNPPFRMPIANNSWHNEQYIYWKNEKDLVVKDFTGEEMQSYFRYLRSFLLLDEAFEKSVAAGHPMPERQVHHVANFSHGNLLFITLEPCPEAHELFKRFANVFEQTYTRFLDLQKAEEQARESEIQLSLERVRAKSMAMHKSDELADLSLELVKQVHALGIDTWFCAFNIYDDHPEGSVEWGSNGQGTFPQYRTPREGVFLDYYEAGQRGETFLINEISEEECPAHYEYLCSLPGVGDQLLKMKDEGIPFPASQIDHVAYFKYGYIIFITFEPAPEAHDIFKRFAKVFQQTYTRFLDLKRAEAQAKESKIELSLERIRSQVTAMQESSDLFDIVVKMRMEFISLGHEADYFWHMRWLTDVYEMSMTTEDGHRLGMVVNVPKFVHDHIPGLAEWEKGNDPIYVLALDADDAWDYIENMNTHGRYEQVDPNAPTYDDIQHIGGLTFIIARTSHGEIGFSLPGVVPDPPNEALDTLERFAGVFDLAYMRFEDLKTAEKDLIEIKAAREKAEKALIELKATQAQLVQQEKLASLGQLTAGIAHEIKNPLNFVNNFSELSVELIEEAREEVRQMTGDRGPGSEKAKMKSEKQENPLSRGDGIAEGDGRGVSAKATNADSTTNLLLGILDDIEANLKTIHKHGSRADSIVKSMLQHSRGGEGKMEPTSLNPIIKEYVNLAFHGMRAGKYPINVDIDLQLDETVGEVPLIAEDFSRVILNLVNNAFDAMREKQGSGSKGQGAGEYEPKLTVRTISDSGKVTIEIEDNGSGIPEEMQDKILQPFFTTKKGTAGTGLGLSITNDIVKAHGGTLEINSSKGKTIFSITLQNNL